MVNTVVFTQHPNFFLGTAGGIITQVRDLGSLKNTSGRLVLKGPTSPWSFFQNGKTKMAAGSNPGGGA